MNLWSIISKLPTSKAERLLCKIRIICNYLWHTVVVIYWENHCKITSMKHINFLSDLWFSIKHNFSVYRKNTNYWTIINYEFVQLNAIRFELLVLWNLNCIFTSVASLVTLRQRFLWDLLLTNKPFKNLSASVFLLWFFF